MPGIIRTLLYYALAAGLFIVIDRTNAWSGGPCSPGVGFLVLILFGPLCLILAAVNLIRQFIVRESSGGAAVIHIIAFVVWLVVLKSA